MRRGALLAALLVAAGAGGAGAELPPQAFTGLYERVGRSGGGVEPALIDDLVRLAPDPAGGGLLMSVCQPEGAPGRAPLRLTFQEFGAASNLLLADEAGQALFCRFFSDAGTAPILTCQTDAGARYTLWPAPDRSDCP